MAGVFLCLTGCEAMFADLGHFSRPSIQVRGLNDMLICLYQAIACCTADDLPSRAYLPGSDVWQGDLKASLTAAGRNRMMLSSWELNFGVNLLLLLLLWDGIWGRSAVPRLFGDVTGLAACSTGIHHHKTPM